MRKPNTIAKSLAIGDPADGYFASKVMRDTGGWGEDVSDPEIAEAMTLLAKTEGIWAETAGGVTLAVAKKLIEQGRIPRDEDIVIIHRGERQVGGVAVRAMGDHPSRVLGRSRHLEQRPERHALPVVVELGPAGDAVHVAVHRGGPERPELLENTVEETLRYDSAIFMLSRKALEHMRQVAREHWLESLIAPVMPTWKERYPLAPIEHYMEWRREDGLLFDPWLRTHERLGARILKPEPHSILTTGTVAEWEEWTEMAFPESGEYVIPGGQATLAIDREQDVGRYAEPNVWMLHEL